MQDKLHRGFENSVAMIHDLATEGEVWTSRPSWLEFSTNNHCNLRCVMCGNQTETPSTMTPQAARALLAEVLPDAALLMPSANSEPLLGDLDLILEECRRHDVYLDLYTNATLLTAERLRAIADRVYRLHISFDSHERELYERVRVGASYDGVVSHIRDLLAVAAEERIPVVFVMVLMAENTPLVADYVDFLADLGAAAPHVQVRFQSLEYQTTACPDLDPRRRYSDRKIAAWLDAAVARAVARGIILEVDADPPLRRAATPVAPIVRAILPDLLNRFLESVRRRYPHFCSMASCYVKVAPDGSVYPCCYAPAELRMGSIHESSLSEIWNGPAYRAFRRRMFARDYPSPCVACPVLVRNRERTSVEGRADRG
jgi:radical SAM protein with 4Fe4S-binding SPASM domain